MNTDKLAGLPIGVCCCDKMFVDREATASFCRGMWRMEAVQESDLFGVRKITLGVPRRWYAWPLIRGLSDLPHVTLLQDCPATIAMRFHRGGLDCALLPVIECLVSTGVSAEPGRPPCKVIPGIGVCTDGNAETEVLFARAEPSAMRRATADFAQGGMLALTQVVLAERFHVAPELVAYPGDGKPTDGVLLSGNEAFAAEHPFPLRYDIGELWRQATDLPLVHMVWATQRGAPLPELRRLLAHAVRKGLEEIDEIAATVSRVYGTDLEAVRRYLTDTVQYRIGAAEMDGVRKFMELAGKHGLCDPRAEIHLC